MKVDTVMQILFNFKDKVMIIIEKIQNFCENSLLCKSKKIIDANFFCFLGVDCGRSFKVLLALSMLENRLQYTYIHSTYNIHTHNFNILVLYFSSPAGALTKQGAMYM